MIRNHQTQRLITVILFLLITFILLILSIHFHEVSLQRELEAKRQALLQVQVVPEQQPALPTSSESRTLFLYYDIPLAYDLQLHAYEVSQKYSLDVELLFAIMDHESRFIEDVRDNVNTDGTRDRGLMQINESNWAWMASLGLDVNDPRENIECGAVILSILLERYGLEEALMGYECGENRMLELREEGHVTEFADYVMNYEISH